MEEASPASLVQSPLVGVWYSGKGTGRQRHLVSGLCPRAEWSKKMKSQIQEDFPCKTSQARAGGVRFVEGVKPGL